jgi:hypothetical protein
MRLERSIIYFEHILSFSIMKMNKSQNEEKRFCEGQQMVIQILF